MWGGMWYRLILLLNTNAMQKILSAAFIRSVVKASRYGDGNGLYLIVDPSGRVVVTANTGGSGRIRDT